MTYNRFIGNAPILVPLLIVAALVLVTWYRPAAQATLANAPDGKSNAESLRAIAPQGGSKPAQ